MAISVDLRKRVVEAYEEGGVSYAAVGRRFSVHWRSVKAWVELSRSTGSLEPSKAPRGRKTLLQGDKLDQLKQLVEEDINATEADLVERLKKRFGIETSTSSVGRAIRKMGLTRKKRRSGHGKPTPSGSNSSEPTTSSESER